MMTEWVVGVVGVVVRGRLLVLWMDRLLLQRMVGRC
jgi:hypothetical protein